MIFWIAANLVRLRPHNQPSLITPEVELFSPNLLEQSVSFKFWQWILEVMTDWKALNFIFFLSPSFWIMYFVNTYLADKKEEVSPTQSTGPYTPGTEPWWQIRLPVYIRPKHYDLILYIDLSKPNFTGKVDILTNVSKSTPYILLHSRNLNFTTVKVQKKSGGRSWLTAFLYDNILKYPGYSYIIEYTRWYSGYHNPGKIGTCLLALSLDVWVDLS